MIAVAFRAGEIIVAKTRHVRHPQSSEPVYAKFLVDYRRAIGGWSHLARARRMTAANQSSDPIVDGFVTVEYLFGQTDDLRADFLHGIRAVNHVGHSDRCAGTARGPRRR